MDRLKHPEWQQKNTYFQINEVISNFVSDTKDSIEFTARYYYGVRQEAAVRNHEGC